MAVYRELERWAEKVLAEAGVPDGGYDAGALLRYAAGWDRTQYLMHRGEPAPEQIAAAYRDIVRRRAGRIPLQHIIGETWFMGLPFLVNGDVLIPRQDTETLVCEVLSDRKGVTGGSLLDLGTGSGCIAISLAALGDWDEVTASDLSEPALAEARRNAERNLKKNWQITGGCQPAEENGPGKIQSGTVDGHPRITGRRFALVKSDLFDSFGGRRFDVITANPPYIPDGDIRDLMPEVRDHDPRMALAGGPDGLDFYRRIASESLVHLRKDAQIYLEIGSEQARAVSDLMEAADFRDIRVIRDDAGRDRVIAARAPEEEGA